MSSFLPWNILKMNQRVIITEKLIFLKYNINRSFKLNQDIAFLFNEELKVRYRVF